WEKRRKALVANIKAQAPDILGIQEATPAKVKSAKNGKSVKQHDDLLYLLGSKYRYATTTNSEGTRLAYNTARLTLVKSGAQKLTTVGKYSRYAVWAILKDKIGGRQVFAVNTHLEPPSGGNANKNIWNARKKQANQIMDLIAKQNTGKLPVVLTGDLNSSRANKPSNGVYREFLERGLVDPLGDADDTWFRITPGIAEHEIGVEYNSFNNLERKARRTAYGVGTHVDYILVSRGVRVAKVQTVVSLDRNGKFKGTIPSDHNLITTTIHVG
ncbi:MAG: endonuclease/exonuclease/phosphatase family protein, partial [Propionicimonas sp.]|nr:endonuclease/exonuclease/phosphatase family protein [Propionicimonas sp.]